MHSFRAKLWKYKGPSGWYFVTVPKKLSAQIRADHFLSEEGWGRLKTTCQTGQTQWATAIWFDTKFGAYLLPVKAAVRKSEGLQVDRLATYTLCLEAEDGLLLA